MSVEEKLQKEIDDLENQLYSFKIKMSTEISYALKMKKGKFQQEINSNKISKLKNEDEIRNELLVNINNHKELLDKLNSNLGSKKSKIATENDYSQKLAELRVKNLQLTNLIRDKKGKLALQEKNIKKLQNKITSRKNVQKGKQRIRQWITNPEKTEENKLFQSAKESFYRAKKEWQTAKSFYEKQNFDKFFLVAFSALELAINSCYVALIEEEAKYNIKHSINDLFEKGMILNTTKLDNIIRMVNQLKDGISVNPQANYRIQIYEFFKHNFKIMLIE